MDVPAIKGECDRGSATNKTKRPLLNRMATELNVRRLARQLVTIYKHAASRENSSKQRAHAARLYFRYLHAAPLLPDPVSRAIYLLEEVAFKRELRSTVRAAKLVAELKGWLATALLK